MYGKGMNAVRQISRRFGRAMGARTRAASSDCIAGAVSFGADPLKTRACCRTVCLRGRCVWAYGKGMSLARQISRRLGRTTGARTRSAVSDCVVRTVLFVPDPLKTEMVKYTPKE